MESKNNFGWLLIIILIAIVFFVGFGLMGSSGSYGSFGPWMMGPWMIFPFMFLIGIGFFIYFMINGGPMGCMNHSHNETENPLAILKNRYAKGEITKKEYEDMRKELRK